MRKSGICPKCEGRKFWRIDKMLEHAHGGVLAQLPVAGIHRWGGFGDKEAGTFQTIVCAGCGFTEWYAVGMENIKEDPEHGIYFIDLEPKAGLR